MEAKINTVIQVREYEILIANDWNLDQPCGSELITSILKLANSEYDYTCLLGLVTDMSLKDIFEDVSIHKR